MQAGLSGYACKDFQKRRKTSVNDHGGQSVRQRRKTSKTGKISGLCGPYILRTDGGPENPVKIAAAAGLASCYARLFCIFCTYKPHEQYKIFVQHSILQA
jgi:hypothetical protein